MAGHNGWHLALFLIEQGRFDEVLADYDRFSAPKLANDATLDRVDAAALLRRLELAGVDVGIAGRLSPTNGWRMWTTTCSPSTICIAPSPPRARPTRPTSTDSAFARRLRTRRLRRQSPCDRGSRPPAHRRSACLLWRRLRSGPRSRFPVRNEAVNSASLTPSPPAAARACIRALHTSSGTSRK